MEHKIVVFAAADKQCPGIASYDDWSDVYKVGEFAKERDELPSSSMPSKGPEDGGCTFFLICLAIAAIIYFLLMFTSCASTKGEHISGGQANWPVEETNLSTKGQASATSSKTSYKPEIRHKEGWIHPAAR